MSWTSSTTLLYKGMAAACLLSLASGCVRRLCYVLDIIYDKRPVQRFWFLEVVARMPYFSYISMLHLYESLGWWRAGAALRKVHIDMQASYA